MSIGCNFRLSEIQALMIYSVVKEYKNIIANKKNIAKLYINACKQKKIDFIDQNKNDNFGNYYKFIIISPNKKISETYPNIKTTTSKVYDYALGNSKDLPNKHLCLPIWYDLEESITEKVLKEIVT